MNHVIKQPGREAPTRIESPVDDSTMEWVVAFLFWGLLLLAASLYAAVTLSPKLTTWIDLDGEFQRAQSQLVSLEQQVGDMRKVTNALETDPSLLRELARIDLDAAGSNEERLAVPVPLTLQSRMTRQRTSSPEVTRSWYVPVLSAFGSNHQLRVTSLVVSALLVLIAFSFFHPSQGQRFSSGWVGLRDSSRAFLDRYRGHPSRRR